MAGYTVRRSASRSSPLSANQSPSFSSRFLQAVRMAFTRSTAAGSSTIFFRPTVGNGMGSRARAASQP